MSQVTFYLLNEQDGETDSRFPAACHLAATFFRKRQACLIFCDDQQAAEQMDELLWQLPPNSFVPHNLPGEGPQRGSPVLIDWQADKVLARPVLINLSATAPAFANKFRQVIDFVPAAEQAKQQARERYKQFRVAGHTLETSNLDSITETEHG